LLRWVVPFLLIGLLVSNVFLLNLSYYGLIFAGQLLFYVWAAVRFLFRSRMRRVRFVLLGYFLSAMNGALLVGFSTF
jgi:hypothetical protein